VAFPAVGARDIKGDGKSTFEHDFPSGTDMMRKILEDLYPQETLERSSL